MLVLRATAIQDLIGQQAHKFRVLRSVPLLSAGVAGRTADVSQAVCRDGGRPETGMIVSVVAVLVAVHSGSGVVTWVPVSSSGRF
jgi:hypothetical protein